MSASPAARAARAPVAARCLPLLLLLLPLAGRAEAATDLAPAAPASGPTALATGPSAANDIAQVAEPWRGKTVNDLFGEYNNIFKHGNRNAASHLWVRFLLERSQQMTPERLDYMFSGFCAVSGSPVRPSDYNRYLLRLDRVDGSGKVPGFMHYCCWPCVCDTQDFIKVDTRTVMTSEGPRTYDFAVIGNPCDREAELRKPFQDAFGRGTSTLHQVAAEVRCADGKLIGAPLSDHGYVIIARFFESPASAAGLLAAPPAGASQPGRITEVGGMKFQDETEFKDMCTNRAMNGYNSGMGEIFRRVASISPIVVGQAGDAEGRALYLDAPKEDPEAVPAERHCDDPDDEATCVPPPSPQDIRA